MDMALEHGLRGWLHWIGVDDISTDISYNEGRYTYNSNNQPINFNPDWYEGTGSRDQSNNCIGIYLNSPSHDFYKQWADLPCTNKIPSICCSIN